MTDFTATTADLSASAKTFIRTVIRFLTVTAATEAIRSIYAFSLTQTVPVSLAEALFNTD